MKCGLGLCFALSLLGVWLAPGRARAFEREWHTGGGLGVTIYPHYYTVGPAWGLHAAYGVSDFFDLKVEVLGSYHTYTSDPGSPSDFAMPHSLAAGLAYKLDVLQWIPYAGLLVGVQHVTGTLPLGEPFHRNDALAALVLGLDYAMTRNFGLGFSARTDMLLTAPSQGQAVTALLRAEYHWGF